LAQIAAERFLLQIQPLVAAEALTSLRALDTFYSFLLGEALTNGQ